MVTNSRSGPTSERSAAQHAAAADRLRRRLSGRTLGGFRSVAEAEIMPTLFTIPRNRRLAKQLGEAATTFLESGANAITRILPHTEARDWTIHPGFEDGDAHWEEGSSHQRVGVVFGVRAGDGYAIRATVTRKRVPKGVGAIQRSLSPRELGICRDVTAQLTALFSETVPPGDEVIIGLARVFDELVVARHLKHQHDIALNPGRIFAALRSLAEQTYENRALAFGCIVDPSRKKEPDPKSRFPEDLLAGKRFRALSDAYYTSYLVSDQGAVVRFVDLRTEARELVAAPRNYFPEWCRDLALASRGHRVGMALTRNGDLLVFDEGTLRFTYRFCRWQYWNHTHLVDLLKNSARVQKVPKAVIPRVVSAIYRAALDVSFRRSGGMFVVLRNRSNVSEIVRAADQITHESRTPLTRQFDSALPTMLIQNLPRALLIELAALDGAVVVSNKGELLAYGAVLQPKKKGSIDAEEGSRTKAAIGASKYGLAVKVSSDGDITVYVQGKEFLRV